MTKAGLTKACMTKVGTTKAGPLAMLQVILRVGSDHSMDSCLISTQGNSANMDSICKAMERNKRVASFDYS